MPYSFFTSVMFIVILFVDDFWFYVTGHHLPWPFREDHPEVIRCRKMSTTRKVATVIPIPLMIITLFVLIIPNWLSGVEGYTFSGVVDYVMMILRAMFTEQP